MPDASQRTVRLFVYSSLLEGEREHELLAGAVLVGPAKTPPQFHLFELGPYGALVRGGKSAVPGEVYEVDLQLRRRLDVHRENGILFERETIELEDGSQAEAYLMPSERVRGKRRIRGGGWRDRFGPGPGGVRAGPFVTWARGRRR